MESDIGNIRAIREWTRRYFYTKQDINYFMTKIDEGLKGYALMIIGPRNKKVTINPGNYQFTLNSDGWYRYLFFFNRNQEITLSVQDGITMNYQLDAYNDTICLSPWIIATAQMTSNSAPAGYQVSGYMNSASSGLFQLFDRDSNTKSNVIYTQDNYTIYKFPVATRIYKGSIICQGSATGGSNSYNLNITILGSNDNEHYSSLANTSIVLNTNDTSTKYTLDFYIGDPKDYMYYKINFDMDAYNAYIYECYLYTVEDDSGD